MACNGAVNGRIFLRFIRRLAPTLRSGDVVVMDNLSVHKSLAARAIIEGAGATVLFTPTYSPEYNPIELWWADLKRGLRRHAATTRESLVQHVRSLQNTLPFKKIAGWFRHCIPLGHVNRSLL